MLKKKKMRKMLCDMGYDMPILKECTYISSRGTEWLRAYCLLAGNDVRVSLCHDVGSHISLEVLENPRFNECDSVDYTTRTVYSGDDYRVLLMRVNDCVL